MRIPPALLAQIVEHARREAPNESCGLVAARDGEAYEVIEGKNLEASPFRFTMDGHTVAQTFRIEDEGGTVGAIYHSHTRTAPYPSATDVNLAELWPGVPWLIVGLAGEEPEVRLFSIEDGEVEELEIT